VERQGRAKLHLQIHHHDRHSNSGLAGLIFAFALNCALAAAAYVATGHSASWLAPDRAEFSAWKGYGLPFAQFLAFGYLVDRGFRFLIRHVDRAKGTARPFPRLAVQLVQILIYFVTLSAVATRIFNQSVTGILATSGIVGLVLGFGLRGLIADLFSGIALHVDKDINVGDWIDFSFRGKDLSGQLHDIHWRSVILHDRSGNVMMVPNGEFASAVVINRSRPNNLAEYSVSIALGNEYESGRVLTVLEAVLQMLCDNKMIVASPPPRAVVAKIENGLLHYRLCFHLHAHPRAVEEAQSAAIRYAVQFLKAAGILIYPLLPGYFGPDKLPPDRLQNLDVRCRILATVPLFRALTEEQLQTIADGTQVRRLTEGKVLMQMGESSDSMYVIAEGALDVAVERGDELSVIATLWPGEWVGEMSLLTGEPRNATVITHTASVLYVIGKPAMADLFEKNPELIPVLAQIAGRRRKSRTRAAHPVNASADAAKTNSIIARIREFFGIAAPHNAGGLGAAAS
jgi:small-conductance mechanosensitive channel/CRP-like cAMP-binding protein